MRRLLATLLLAFLSLQSVWAGMSSVCAHEAGQQARHLAHHAHQHASVTAESGDPDSNRFAAGADGDCAACHINLASSLPAMHALAGSAPPAPFLTLAPPARFRSAEPRAIDRPQWLAPV